jgi:ArsR family transcriptional regulator, arsenate/arsenite/antimonite-responsive transcriptional repressor / arsenate reductase (thioredoxin)
MRYAECCVGAPLAEKALVEPGTIISRPSNDGSGRVMRVRDIDLAGRRSKHLSEFTGERFDCVISLCERVREVCPEFPGASELIHWSIPDPGREPRRDEATLPAFVRTAAELCIRIDFLIEAIEQTTALPGGGRT